MWKLSDQGRINFGADLHRPSTVSPGVVRSGLDRAR